MGHGRFQKKQGMALLSEAFFSQGGGSNLGPSQRCFLSMCKARNNTRPSLISVLNEARFDRRRIALIQSRLESGVCFL